MSKLILTPIVALAAGLILTVSAQAQPPRPPGPGGPGFRPGMPPPPVVVQPQIGVGIGIRPAPGIGIGIGIGGPSYPPPHYPPAYYPPPPPRPPIVIVDPICDHYRVVYRDCSHDPWRTYRVYESHRYAHVVADQLRDMGYQARVLHD
jgi:hypothetical protein